MVGCYLPLGFRTGHIGAEYVLLQGRMTPFFSMELAIYCTGSYDAIGIMYCRTNVGGVFGFVVDVGQATIQGNLCEGVLVLAHNLFESLAIHFIMEGIRLAQDLLNLCIEPGVGLLCS